MIQHTEDSPPPSPPYIPASPIYSPAVCSVPSSIAWEPPEDLQSTSSTQDNTPVDPEDYVYASTPDRSSCSTPESQITTWPEDRKGLAALVPWYHREFPAREDHPARTRRQYEKEEQEFEDLKWQFWWQYDDATLGALQRRDADESYKRYRKRGGQRRQKQHHQGTEDINREFPLAPGSLLEPPFEHDDPHLLSPALHRIENGYYRRRVRPLYERMRQAGTPTEHWQDLRDAWWTEHGEPLVHPTWWLDSDDEGLPIIKESATPAVDDQSLHPDYPPELLDQDSSLKDPATEPLADQHQPYTAEPDYARHHTGVNDGTHAISTTSSSTPGHISKGTQVDERYTTPFVQYKATQTDAQYLQDDPLAPLSVDYYLPNSTSSSSSRAPTNHRFTMSSDGRPPPFPGGCQLCRRAAGQDA